MTIYTEGSLLRLKIEELCIAFETAFAVFGFSIIDFRSQVLTESDKEQSLSRSCDEGKKDLGK